MASRRKSSDPRAALERFVLVERTGAGIESIRCEASAEWIDGYSGAVDPNDEIIRLLGTPESGTVATVETAARLHVESHHGTTGYHDRVVAALVARPRPRLQSLSFDRWMLKVVPELLLSTHSVSYTYSADVRFASLAGLWRAAPLLRTLVIAQTSALELGVVGADRLEGLCLGVIERAPDVLAPLRVARLPMLKTLRLSAFRGDECAHAIVANAKLGALEHLSLLRLERGGALVTRLAASRHAPTLRSLDLRGASDEAKAIERLLTARKRFPALELVVADLTLKKQLRPPKGGPVLRFIAATPPDWRRLNPTPSR